VLFRRPGLGIGILGEVLEPGLIKKLFAAAELPLALGYVLDEALAPVILLPLEVVEPDWSMRSKSSCFSFARMKCLSEQPPCRRAF
jgi:hypothetical protein